MSDLLVATALALGTAFLVLAAVALNQMPDVYTRLSASTKAVTLGASLMFVGAAVAFAWEPPSLRAIAGVAFLFATAPVAAHVLGRTAHRTRQPIWPGTVADELAGAEEVR